MRVKTTIPPAGESKRVNITGVSLIVENCGTYTVDQIPTFEFNKGPSDQPIYKDSTYPSNDGFDSIVIYGTVESAGDEILLFSTNDCLQLDIRFPPFGRYRSVMGQSFAQTITAGTVLTYSDIELNIAVNGQIANRLYISAEQAFLYAFDVDPDNTAGAVLGHISGDSDTNNSVLMIEGISQIEKLRMLNLNAGDVELTITPEL